MNSMVKKESGIITEYYKNYNFGGSLQSFALQRYAEIITESCDQITYDHEYKSNIYWLLKGFQSSKGKEKANTAVYIIKSIVKLLILPVSNMRLIKRKRAIAVFSKSVPHSVGKYTANKIEKTIDLYVCFICGSDCVWNMTNNPYCTALGFVPDGKKKISYAPSLGSATIPEGWPEKYLEYVKRLDAVSVREKSIAEELQALIPEKEIFVAADPTLLFSAEEWQNFLPHRNNEKDYALHYILSEDMNQMQQALIYTSNCSLKSLTFPNIHNYIYFWQRKYGDIQNYSADPLDFVELIKNAEVVVTDSFHAVIFSTLFHKPFYALKRETQKDYVGRVENFLEEVGLISQMVSAEELAALDSVPKIDFSYADKVIAEKREASIKFLKDNLE